MPKRNDIKSVMVIGSGPIVIGQAAEFDYSGTQACRVLREEGIRVILVNSNPATIMTDPEMADATYIEPIATPILERIIAKERPDALLPTLGGQTALNAAVALGEAGVLKKYNVELIGASLEAIDRGEDRESFKEVVEAAGAESARSDIAHTLEEVDAIAERFGFPLVVRPSFTMGGLGSGIAHNTEELHRIAGAGIHYSPTDEVLIEEGIEGWKEYELELMRDRNDNVVVVCPIENVDPVGVHTGDSITVAPVFTLTDREYQKLRDIGIAIIRGVGVDTGGCNIQFAIHPATGRIIVIEMNPRVSRSSALASKATGFPIAKIATKLALGYTLDEIQNDITKSTPASFEPTIDYVVTKVPRFAFEKFPGADPTLTTSMKSVGEAMALAGNFQESLGKAMRSIDKRDMGFSWSGEKPGEQEVAELLEAMKVPTEHRYLQLMRAIWGGATEEQIFAATKIDPWFVKQFMLINDTAMQVRDAETLSPRLLKKAKLAGLSDLQIARLRGLGDAGENTVRELRWNYGLHPVYKTVDTCAAEFDAVTPYYYSCYADETELRKRDRAAVIILGSGPNRIGQGIEFDYTCVHAVQELGKDYDTIMVNCNPETVSTDYDMSDRLYFEPLTFEDVIEIYEAEKKMGPIKGVIVQLGGQTPLSLAARLKAAGVPILGTTPESIDLAENRELFGEVLRAEKLNAPRFGTALSLEEALDAAHSIGYPVLVRPSYVLGGRGMEIVYDDAQLEKYVNRALNEAKADTVVSGRLPSPLLIDKFLQDAIEIDVDALFDGNELYIGGIMEHIEEAGVHSGDAACTLPPSTLSDDQIRRLREATYAIAKGCGVCGLINVQYAFMANTLYVIEANPRASRTGAVRVEGHRRGPREGRRAHHGGRDNPAAARQRPAAAARRRWRCSPGPAGGHQGIRAAVQALPHARGQDRRHPARARDALDRRGHGLRPRLPARFREEPAFRIRRRPAHKRQRVHLGERHRQAPAAAVRGAPCGARLPDLGHRRHGVGAAPLRHRIEDCRQDHGARGFRPGRPRADRQGRRQCGQERGGAHRGRRDRPDPQHAELAWLAFRRILDPRRGHRRRCAPVHHDDRVLCCTIGYRSSQGQ